MAKILLYGNTVFIPVSTSSHRFKNTEYKYMLASISGLILGADQFTLEEIIGEYGHDYQTATDFKELVLIWSKS